MPFIYLLLLFLVGVDASQRQCDFISINSVDDSFPRGKSGGWEKPARENR